MKWLWNQQKKERRFKYIYIFNDSNLMGNSSSRKAVLAQIAWVVYICAFVTLLMFAICEKFVIVIYYLFIKS